MIEIKPAIRKTGIVDWCTCCSKSMQDNKRITFMNDEHISGISVVLCPECLIELLEKITKRK